MSVDKLCFGRVISILPYKTLVRDTSPPYKYYTVKGGWGNSYIENGAEIIKFYVSDAEDGTVMSWLDKNPLIGGETND